MTLDQLTKANGHMEAIDQCRLALRRWEARVSPGDCLSEEAAQTIKRVAIADLRATIAEHEAALASL